MTSLYLINLGTRITAKCISFHLHWNDSTLALLCHNQISLYAKRKAQHLLVPHHVTKRLAGSVNHLLSLKFNAPHASHESGSEKGGFSGRLKKGQVFFFFF